MLRDSWLPIAVTLCACSWAASGCGDDDAPNAPQGGRAGSATAGAQAGRTAGVSGGAAGKAGAAGVASAGEKAVTLHFKARVGAEDFACGREYPELGATKVAATPQDFRFFVQDVKLLERDGEAVAFELEERAPVQNRNVALLDFTDTAGRCAIAGNVTNTQLTGHVPDGDYDGVEFVIGVPDRLNHQDITTARAPLRDISTHWGWLSGYRFIMAEIAHVGADEEAADAGEPDAGPRKDPLTLIHVGSGGCSGTPSQGFHCMRANRARIRIQGFDPRERAIIADFAQLFARTDLASGVQCHGVSEACSDMYAALGLDMASGEPQGTQRVFRAE